MRFTISTRIIFHLYYTPNLPKIISKKSYDKTHNYFLEKNGTPQKMSSGQIYYQRQQGGLCRMHAINAFFGYEKLSSRQFYKFIKEYDSVLKLRFNVSISCEKFDLVNSDQHTLVSYILKRHKIYARYYALNAVYGKPIDQETITQCKYNFIFVYNQFHIWGMKQHQGQWYKVDSMSGVRKYPLSNLYHEKNIGLIIPLNMKYEFEKKRQEIQTTLLKEGISIVINQQSLVHDQVKQKSRQNNENDICKYVIKLNKEKQILGDLEIPLGVAIDILETNIRTPHSSKFKRIYDLVERYNFFIQIFTKGNYNNISLISQHIPWIIYELLSL